MYKIFVIKEAKRNSVNRCRLCDGKILKGEKRIIWGNVYLPMHYNCFLYALSSQFEELSDIKKMEEIKTKVMVEMI
jgi:hypothetical protein